MSARVIGQALRGNKNLTYLNLSHNSIGDVGGKYLAIMLCRNRCLRDLDVSTNQIGDDGASEFADFLELNPSEPEKVVNITLQTLRLSKNAVGDDGALAFGKCLLNNHTLRELWLDSNCFGDGGVAALARGVQENDGLHVLDLGRNIIGPKGVSFFGKALRVNKHLRRLGLSGTETGDEGVQAIATGMVKHNKALVELNLSESGIGDVALGALSKVWAALNSGLRLRSVDLSANGITDEGVAVLCTALVRNPVAALAYLNLNFNRIGDIGARALSLCLASNKNLTMLHLRKNGISTQGAAALKAAWIETGHKRTCLRL